jgi:hypothetical protein
MRTTTTLTILAVLAAAGTHAATRAEPGETTRATSLLTAERRAHEAAERLRVPAAGPARWKRGGEGWMPAWSAETRPGEKRPDRAPD